MYWRQERKEGERHVILFMSGTSLILITHYQALPVQLPFCFWWYIALSQPACYPPAWTCSSEVYMV